MAELTASPLGPTEGFNWVYLVELLICGILSLFFLFYFNRLFATVISYAIRAWTWHKYRAYVDITALQISPLGGRIFFKSIRYHAHNITVLVHDGNITWRYWLGQVQEAQIFEDIAQKDKAVEAESSDEEQASSRKHPQRPCKIAIKVSGVEAFIYNRSPAYDGMVEATIKKAEELSKRHSSSEITKEGREELAHNWSHSISDAKAETELPFWLRILPIEISCKRAAAAIGNENTTSIITAKVDQSGGRIDVGSAKLDLYKLLFGFEFKTVVVQMKKNRDYKQSQTSAAHDLLQKNLDEKDQPKRKQLGLLAFFKPVVELFRRNKGSVRASSVKSRPESSVDQLPGEAQWQGLSRYLTQGAHDEHAQWQDAEYAKATTLADCEQVDMRFYWDISAATTDEALLSAEPPEYGIDLAVHGGNLVYGPWADRQRINLQHVFFPASCVDATPLAPSKIDQPRLATIFKLYLTVEKDVTLRIPTREASKDHFWQHHDQVQRPKQRTKKRKTKQSKTSPENADSRPYGWIDITVKPDTTVNYTMDMYARETGYHNTIAVEVKNSEITTSVNHALLWRTGPISLLGDLSNPLSWNAARSWPFKIQCHDLDLFILRDHMFLIIDLVEDWGSGSSPEFYTFVPFRYVMDMRFSNFKLFLNTNDGNIIDNPADMDTNDFLTLEGAELAAILDIPIENYRSSQNEITFDVLTRHLRMRALLAAKSTINALLEEPEVASLHELTLKGTFCSNQAQGKGLTDVLRMDIDAIDFSLLAYGFVLRHLISIKDNYFGPYMHFKTLEEFQSTDSTEVKPVKTQTSNELDVILSIVIRDASVLLPTNLYAATNFIKADMSDAVVDLRVTSYYLDLAIDLSPISIRLGAQAKEAVSSAAQLFVSHTTVNGQKAFGLPPEEVSYVSTWDIDVGAVDGEMEEVFLHDAVLAAKALLFTFLDRENILPLEIHDDVFDVSFVQVRTAALRLWLHAGSEAILLAADPITVHVHDWANEHFSQCVNVIAPELVLACIDRQVGNRHNKHVHRHTPRTYAMLKTSLVLDVVGRKRHFKTESLKQQAFLRQQDARTHRAAFLQRSGKYWSGQTPGTEPGVSEAAAMPCPPLPPPIVSGHPSLRPSSIKSVQYANPSLRMMPSHSSLASSTNFSESESERVPTRDIAPALLSSSSSTYAKPAFALDGLRYDDTYLPTLAPQTETSRAVLTRSSSSESFDGHVSEDLEHTAIMINLGSCVRGFVEPKVAEVAAHLLDALQPRLVEEVMDSFQTTIMSEVGDKLQAQFIEPTSMQIGITLPSAILRVINPVEQSDKPDVVELSLEALDLMIRLRNGREAQQPSLAIHTKLSALRLTMTEDLGSQYAISASIDDVSFQMASSISRAVRLIVGGTSLDLASECALYLSSVVERVIPLVNGTQEHFARLQKAEQARLQLLLYQLTQFGEHVNDPPFLTMMTYVLRAYPAHYRNQESWKVLMRFRSILQSLPRSILNDLQNTLKSDEIVCPEDAAQKMLESWSQWRNWDVIHVGRTMVFQSILGTRGETTASATKALSVTWTQENIRLIVTHPSGDNVVELKELSFGLELKPQSQPSGLMLIEDNIRSITLSHIHTAAVTIELRWSLVDIAEKVLPRILDSIPHETSAAPETSPKDGFRNDLHIALSADSGSIAVHTLNLQHLAEAQGLKLSLIGTTQAEDPYGACMVAILNSDQVGTQLHSRTGMVWQALLISPSVYVDNIHYVKASGLPPSVNTAIAYQELEFSVQEQLPGMLHLVDAIINAEVQQVMRFVNTITSSSQSQPKALRPVVSAAGSTVQSAKFSLALLAGELVIEVALLQSLRYRLDGKAASVRVVPSMNVDQQLSVDIETGHINHALVNVSRGEEHRQEIVRVPPIDAHVVTLFSNKKQEITAQGMVGLLVIDAAAIQSVINTINKPEVKNVIKVAGDCIDDIQESVLQLRHNHPVLKSQAATSGVILQYHTTVAFAGVKVAASTPRGPSHTTAEFEIGIGQCHAIVSNAASLNQKEGLLFPEIKGSLNDIGAKLYVKDKRHVCPAGNITFGIDFALNISKNESQRMTREFIMQSDGFEVRAFPETAAIAVDVVNQLQDRLKQLDLSQEVEYLSTLRSNRMQKEHPEYKQSISASTVSTSNQWTAELVAMRTIVRLKKINMTWMVHDERERRTELHTEDLVLSLQLIELSTHGGKEGRLAMNDLQVQLVPRGDSKETRTLNSALLPEVVFSLAYWQEDMKRHLAFKASGKPLDLRLDSRFIVPFNAIQHSITYAVDKFRAGTAAWEARPTTTGTPRSELFSSLHIASLVAEADFAGAQVLLRGTSQMDRNEAEPLSPPSGNSSRGKYGQFATDEGVMQTTLRSPGISFKLQYVKQDDQASVKGEMLVASSTNLLLPNVVPLILEVSKSIKEVIQKDDKSSAPTSVAAPTDENNTQPSNVSNMTESLVTTDPSAIFGKTKVNLNLRVARQEFGLTCQPIAKVDAKAEMEDFYFSLSTIESGDLGHFFAISANLAQLAVRVQHQYSRDPTLGFEISSIVLSLMNSRHFSGVNGISAILKVDPARMMINGKQLQDLLLFREIWLPPEIRSAASFATEDSAAVSDEVLMRKYQTMAIAAAFPWNVAVTFVELGIDLDLGQSIGKSDFRLKNLWASSQKTSDWEQNLCIGINELSMTSRGRMSGHIILSELGVRTLIRWPDHLSTARKTPYIQASIKFDRIRAKAAFDYQAFAFADIEGLKFLMYNTDDRSSGNDRLVTMLDCSKVYVFFTSASPSQAFGLYQAVDRFLVEKKAAFNMSLKDIERHLRHSVVEATKDSPTPVQGSSLQQLLDLAPISLHTDVVVSLGNISVGAYPSTFFDNQILKFEASNLQARFGAGLEKNKLRSGLGMTIGQLQVALAAVKKAPTPKSVNDLDVDEVIASAVNATGGIILRVPRVIASMSTWQIPDDTHIEYIFRSLFEGKVDVGWNLSRINFIRGMWTAQSRALAARLGKSLPAPAVKITAATDTSSSTLQEKITAEVNLPTSSKYQYIALEPPIIETPQLRDMGEATPPLEWVGLHRDKLPNVTHQIIIVSLLRVAKEVEDAYQRILGTS